MSSTNQRWCASSLLRVSSSSNSRLLTVGLILLEDFVALDERGLGEAVVSNRFLDHVYARPADASNHAKVCSVGYSLIRASTVHHPTHFKTRNTILIFAGFSVSFSSQYVSFSLIL